MTLFHYDNCKLCKILSYKRKVLLSHIFPVNICNNIIDSNAQCCECQDMMEDEIKFEKQYDTMIMNYNTIYGNMPEEFDRDLTIGEKQLLFLKTFKKVPAKIEIKSAEERKINIHKLLKTNSFKAKFHSANKLERTATIAYMKQNHKVCVQLVKRLHNSEHLNKYITILHQIERTYTYRNKQFDTIELMHNFVLEYTEQLIITYQDYLDKHSINEWSCRVMMEYII